jgi:hypothetical protein
MACHAPAEQKKARRRRGLSNMNRRAQLIGAWCGPAFTGSFALGSIVFGCYIPMVVHPSQSAAEFAAQVTANTMQMRLGAFILMVSVCLMAPWGAAIAAQTRRKEGEFPVLTYAQLTCVGCGTAVAMMLAFFWAIMSYRPGEYPPALIQFAADMSYFYPLFSWPIFTFWCFAIALAVLLDDSGTPVYPRWIGYVNIWAGLLYIPGGLILFFKSGPFAWDGILGFYIPFIAFFLWILVMSYVMIRKINAGEVHTFAVATA